MIPLKPLNLSRFKKSTQGVIEFATLIEQADPHTQEAIIAQTQVQDPDLLYRVMRKVVFFEELIYLEESVLAEIISNVSPKILAFSLREMDEGFKKKILSHLNYRLMRQVMEEDDKAGEVAQTLILGARHQILKVARMLEAKNKFMFELYDCPRFHTRQKKTSGESK